MNIQHRLIDIATRDVTCLSADDSVGEAARIMAQRRISSIVITDRARRPLGIVTERDVVRFYAREPGRIDVPLFELMTSPVLTIPGDATINQAAEKMLEKKVRHLTVVDDEGHMVGLVSEHDLTQTMATGLHDEKFDVDELFLRTLIDTIPDLIWLKDRDGVFLSCNTSFERLAGAGEAEIVGKTDYDFFGREQADIFREYDLGAMIADQPNVNEDWLTFAADGRRRLFETIRTPMRDRQGRLVGVLGVARDISERRREKEILAGSERRYRTLVENSPICIHELDLAGRLQSMNRAGLEMLGLEDEQTIRGVPYLQFISEQDAGRIGALMQDAFNGTAVYFEFNVAGVEPLHFKSCFIPIRDTEGNVLKLMGLTENITQRIQTARQLEDYRKRLEGLVAEESTKFRALVEQSLVGIYIIQDDVFRYANPGLIGMFGYDSPDQVVDVIPVYRFVREEDRALVDNNIRRRIRGEETSIRYTFTACRRDGTELVVDAHGRRIEYQGRPAIIGTLIDITEMRRSKEELHRLVEEKSSQLLQSEELLRTLIESIPDAIEFKDGEGRWLESNAAARAAFGLDAETSRGKTDAELAEIADPRYKAALLQCREADRQAWQAGRMSRAEEVIRVTGVGTQTFDVVKVPLFREDGSRKGLVIVGRDVSELKRAEEALRRSLNEHSELVQRIPVGVYKFRMRPDGSAVFDYVSPRWCELLDVTEAEVRQNELGALPRIHPDEVERFVCLSETTRNSMSLFMWEGRVLRRNGEVRWLHIESQPTLQENGDILWDGIQYDVTDRRMAEDALRITASVFDNSQEAIVITDANNFIIDVNPAFTHITGYGRDEALGRNPKFLSSGRQAPLFYADMWKSLQEEKVWRGEIWNRRKNGEVYAELLSISAICDDSGKVQRHVGVFSDITYFKDHEAELSLVANYDALTGVPNRRLLADRLRQSIVHAQRGGKMMAICYIDLDGFKDVNDRYGHETGDRLLVDIAVRLQEVLRAGDTLARLGGDEFVVLFNDLAAEAECFQVMDRIMYAIAVPMPHADQHVTVSASIGVTFYPADNEDGDTLLRHADQAMYVAKQTGKNRYHIYDAIHDQRVRTLHDTRRRIMQGLECGEFELYYQPKLELATTQVVGVEALIRWNHPELGLLNPADFLPAIENSDIEIRLGKWVLGTALAQLHAWERSGIAMEISINISARHLQSPDFVAELKRQLGQYPKLAHGRLQIEVLETAALEDLGKSFEIIKSCRDMGVSFALDDFGTGYSSLVYLRKLGADTLKIDQSFVQNMATNEGDRAIVQGVIALAKTFNRATVAEGVEDPNLVQQLSEMGCGFGQGYGIAHPMRADEFVDWYRKR